MSGRVFATLGLVVILLGTQGCSTLDAIFLDLLIAAGRVTPPGPIPCGEQSLLVFPGSCASISNVCREDSQFVTGDSFAFDDPPEWLSARRSDNSVTVCAASNAPPLVDTPFPYTYADRRPSAGELRVTTVATGVSATASATPSRVTTGDSIQLNVTVQGGAPPYHFTWRQSAPAGSVAVFNNPALQNPVVIITAPPDRGVVRFVVTVTDAAGQTADDETGANVDGLPLRATATATPSTVDRGAPSQLRAGVEGGIPPYTYRWDPSFYLDQSLFTPTPIATPLGTITYTVEVEDAADRIATASVTVTVVQPPLSDQVDLAVTVVDNPDPVVVNHLLTYTTTVTNNGPATATDVIVSVVHPSAIETNSPMPSQGSCMRTSSTVFRCSIGALASGGSMTIGLEGFPFQPGTVTFRALTFSVNEVDSNPMNNDVSQQTTVIANPAPN